MDRVAQDSQLHITSRFNNQKETPVIRSHRRPANKIHRRVTVCALVIALTGGGMAVAEAAVDPKGAVTAMAEVVTAPSVEVEQVARESVSSRSAARKATSKANRINKAVNFALAQRGDRYKWGATGPSKWDCSGLVMKAFAKAGVKLPHYTGGIQKKGKKISRTHLKRGDIVFPQRGHVAIYLGNGKMVAASSGKGKVIVQKVYGFYTARRVI